MKRHLNVQKNHLVLYVRNGRAHRIFREGQHVFWELFPGGELLDLTADQLLLPETQLRHLDLQHPEIRKNILHIKTHNNQLAVLRSGLDLLAVLPPESEAWADQKRWSFTLEFYALEELKGLPQDHFLYRKSNQARLSPFLTAVQAKPGHMAVVFRGTEGVGLLDEFERQIFWTAGQDVQVEHLPRNRSLPSMFAERLPEGLRKNIGFRHLTSGEWGLLRSGDQMQQVLAPDEAVYFHREAVVLEVFSARELLHLPVDHPLLQRKNQQLLQQTLTEVRTRPEEYAVVFRGGQVLQVIPPSSHGHVYQCLPAEVRTASVMQPVLEGHPVWARRSDAGWQPVFQEIHVPEDQVMLVIHHEHVVGVVEPGQTFWLYRSEFPVRLESHPVNQAWVLPEDHPLLLKKNQTVKERYLLEVFPQQEEFAWVEQQDRLIEVVSELQRRLYWNPERKLEAAVWSVFKPLEADHLDWLIREGHTALTTIETSLDECVLVSRGERVLKVILPLNRVGYAHHPELRFEVLPAQRGVQFPENHPALKLQNQNAFKQSFTTHRAPLDRFLVVHQGERVFEVVPPSETRCYLNALAVRAETRRVTALIPNPLFRELQQVIADSSALLTVQTSANEVGVVFQEGKPLHVCPPDSTLHLWNAGSGFQVFALLARVPVELLTAMQRHLPDAHALLVLDVPESHQAIVLEQGSLLEQLGPGQYGYWQHRSGLEWQLVDLRPAVLHVEVPEGMTRDRVPLQMQVRVRFSFALAGLDLLRVHSLQENLMDEVKIAVQHWISGRSLDELFEQKSLLEKDLFQALFETLESTGVKLDALAVANVVLPEEIRSILINLVQTEKLAQANVIRRREETAATRSLLNTARVMEDNPVALRLKELETLERVTEKVGQISVYGGLDSVLTDLIRTRS